MRRSAARPTQCNAYHRPRLKAGAPGLRQSPGKSSKVDAVFAAAWSSPPRPMAVPRPLTFSWRPSHRSRERARDRHRDVEIRTPKTAYHRSPIERAGQVPEMDELPEYFWLHITSTVVLAVLALVATATLVALAVEECQGPVAASLARALATRPLGRCTCHGGVNSPHWRNTLGGAVVHRRGRRNI